MKTFCLSLGLLAGFLLGSLWTSVAQPPAIAQTVRPDGSGAAAGDLCDGTWEVDNTFNRTYCLQMQRNVEFLHSLPRYISPRRASGSLKH